MIDPATTRECDGYPGLAVPAPSWAELEAWRNAPSDTASAELREVTFEEAEAEAEADERETFRYLFGCCGDPGDCGQCGR